MQRWQQRKVINLVTTNRVVVSYISLPFSAKQLSTKFSFEVSFLFTLPSSLLSPK